MTEEGTGVTVHDAFDTLDDYLDSGRILDDGAEARAEGFTTTEDAFAALSRVEAEIARLTAERDSWVASHIEKDKQLWAAQAEVARWKDMCKFRRQRQKQAQAEVARLRDGLRWYAERRNYVPAAPPAVEPPKHLMSTDAWDGQGPGARARRALADQDGAV